MAEKKQRTPVNWSLLMECINYSVRHISDLNYQTKYHMPHEQAYAMKRQKLDELEELKQALREMRDNE